ncbi:hypothetical protein F2Q69_00043065 [Brassica cretica]|uniref:Uncharacterized protein n=1 Tax=Brassica cretica TaxID=69181 RepID=A0A8S9NGD3_BRACR|nr:hypothetical protein F2Q69_00043065 [Brassica cretica]
MTSNDEKHEIGTSGFTNDLRVLNTTSGSEGTSGFPNDLRILKIRSEDQKENLRVPTRHLGPDTMSGSKGDTSDSHMTTGFIKHLRVINGIRARNEGPPGPKGLHPKTSGFEEGIYPTASGFQDESPSGLRVPGRESIQPPGSRTKVHLASGFQDESPSSLQVPGQKSITTFTSSRGASKANRIKHEDPQFRPPGLIKPPHLPNPLPRQDFPS